MWTHSKYRNTKFKGSYTNFTLRDGTNERVFMLTAGPTRNSRRVMSFESHQAAKKSGWVKE